MEAGNCEAFNELGGCYTRGLRGLPQDFEMCDIAF